jgi:cysteinyl-tRNA synthetase
MDLSDAGELKGFPQFTEAEARLEYLYSAVERYRQIPEKKIKDGSGEVPDEIALYSDRVAQVLDDDLNTAQAVAHLSGLLKAVNEICDAAQGKKGSVMRGAYEAAGRALQFTGEVLGLGLDEPTAFLSRIRDRRAKAQGIDGAWVEDCLRRRAEARQNKDFETADSVREELSQKGVEMLDTPAGTSWRLVK